MFDAHEHLCAMHKIICAHACHIFHANSLCAHTNLHAQNAHTLVRGVVHACMYACVYVCEYMDACARM